MNVLSARRHAHRPDGRRPSHPGVLLIALVALAMAGLVLGVPGAAQASTTFSAKIDFGTATTVPVTGYTLDYGQAYGPRTGPDQGSGLSYGWIAMGSATPLDLVGNGRDRGTAEPDRLLATLMHMQLPAASLGVRTPGRWEIAVPSGTYAVTVAVGDRTATDSVHTLQIEDQNGVDAFVPSGTVKYRTATAYPTVTDGRLTISPLGGTNTKINYVSIAPLADADAHPAVRAVTPANTAAGVSPTGSIVADLRLLASGVDTATLSSSTVTLKEAATGTPVATHVITSGGGDVINVSPTAGLKPTTRYELAVTSGVKDLDGRTFVPWRSVFTTGTAGGGGTVAFDKVATGATGKMFSTVVKGPDGKLYAATLDGYVMRYTIAADGTLTGAETISTVRTDATARGLPGAPNRSIIGMAFDPASTATNPILWITSNTMYGGGTPSEPDWSSSIARLTGPALATYTEVINHLPRSVKDHETNSLAFGPDGALYVTQGANNAMGAADPTWGNRPEHLLNAAVLRLDPARLPATGAVDVQTEAPGSYDPFAANAPLTLYATGVRNAFDLVWHSNGHLYTPTNGSAAGGNTPATPAPLPAACSRRVDAATAGAYTGPTVPALTSNPNAETDYVFDIKKNRYYGHPNPSRCEWVLAGGNPTAGIDPFEATSYPAGTLPDRNLDLAGMYDAGLHASADGVVEYRSNTFAGALKGKLLVVRYSSGQDIETFGVDAAGRLSAPTVGTTGFTGFQQPLDLTEDTANGNLYVTELGASKITLLRPHVTAAAASAH
ncbi:Ig-like domain-containing protein [Streptomyces sp. NPDC006733]|uniref:Ig-like domain-containing protein n=1 Tax=Streptomyces sp. NPDC006733 TaxID=3155460 RepID=UPI00340BB684